MLANRGYAVLQVNYRGTTGLGKRFARGAKKQFGRAMHTDLLDGIDYIAHQGMIDTSRVAIMGGSYGGYATLVGLTFTPERFACAVDYAGTSNLVTLLESFPPSWGPFLPRSRYPSSAIHGIPLTAPTCSHDLRSFAPTRPAHRC